MRYQVSAMLFATLVWSGCQSTSTELTETQRTEITSQVVEAVTGFFDAMNARDPERVLGHYLDSDEVAHVAALSIRIGEGFASTVPMYFAQHPDVTFTHRIVHTQVLSPTVAVVYSEGGSSDVEFLVWTHVLVRAQDGSWLIAHEHEAWPDAEPPSRHPGM
jgi:ketosteroid isomerase-like protein